MDILCCKSVDKCTSAAETWECSLGAGTGLQDASGRGDPPILQCFELWPQEDSGTFSHRHAHIDSKLKNTEMRWN